MVAYRDPVLSKLALLETKFLNRFFQISKYYLLYTYIYWMKKKEILNLIFFVVLVDLNIDK